MARNSNLAYDFSAFEPQRRSKPAPELKVIEEKSSKRALAVAFTPKFLGAFSLVVTLICLMVYNQVCLNEVSGEISVVEKQLTIMKSDYVKMSSELGSLTSLRSVAEQAREELGMHRLDKYQTRYINLFGEDKIEQIQPIVEGETKADAKPAAAGIIQGIKEYLSNK